VAQLLPVTSADAAAEHGIAVAVEINGILSAELLRCFLLAVDLLWIPGAGASLSLFFFALDSVGQYSNENCCGGAEEEATAMYVRASLLRKSTRTGSLVRRW
jgi:hypothetical protein